MTSCGALGRTASACGALTGCSWSNSTLQCTNAAYLDFQPYPLEAALASMYVASTNLIAFWVPQQFYEFRLILIALVEGNITISQAAPALVSTFLNKEAMAVRDMLVSFIDLCRAVVYVASFKHPSVSGAVTKFEDLAWTLLNFLDTAVGLFVSDVVPIVAKQLKLALDFMQLLVGNGHVGQVIQDYLALLKTITDSIEDAVMRIFFSIPGMSKLCDLANNAALLQSKVCKGFQVQFLPAGVSLTMEGRPQHTSFSAGTGVPPASLSTTTSNAPAAPPRATPPSSPYVAVSTAGIPPLSFMPNSQLQSAMDAVLGPINTLKDDIKRLAEEPVNTVKSAVSTVEREAGALVSEAWTFIDRHMPQGVEFEFVSFAQVLPGLAHACKSDASPVNCSAAPSSVQPLGATRCGKLSRLFVRPAPC